MESTRVHVLTRGFASPNGRAFLFPLHVHRRKLSDIGISVRCFTGHAPELSDCDALIVDSRFYSPRWAADAEAALDELSSLAESVDALLWFDISDSTGWLQSQVLPFVTLYCKAQLLRDRNAYLQAVYGNRIWADYYHGAQGVEDDEPVWSRPVDAPDHLEKLRVSWHSGLADYSLWGPARMALRKYVPFDGLLRYPTRFTPAERRRTVSLACRFGANYPRETVCYQRRRIREILKRHVPTRKLGRRAYLEEMKTAKVVVSPFGFGEITLKDFEAFLCGAALLKPDMSHMETWPDLFRGGETMFAHRWDMSDLEDVLDAVLSDDTARERVAAAGQNEYRRHIAGETGAEEFCHRFKGLIDSALAA